MTKDEALAFDLALEALEFFKGLALSIEEIERAEEAITAIKQARSAPVQEPFGYFRYDLRLDAWVQTRDSNRGAAFYRAPPAQPAPVHEPEKQECMNCAAFGECNPNNDAGRYNTYKDRLK